MGDRLPALLGGAPPADALAREHDRRRVGVRRVHGFDRAELRAKLSRAEHDEQERDEGEGGEKAEA